MGVTSEEGSVRDAAVGKDTRDSLPVIARLLLEGLERRRVLAAW